MADDDISVRVTMIGWREYNKHAKSNARATDDLGDEIEQAGRKADEAGKKNKGLLSSIIALGPANRKAEKQWFGVAGAMGEANRISTFFRNSMRLLAIPTTLSFLGFLAQGFHAAAAGAIALTSALTPLTGLLLGLPAMLAPIVQGAVVMKFAWNDIGKALGGSKKALNNLTPAGLELFDILTQLKPAWQALRSTAQEGMFPGVVAGLRSVTDLFKVFKPVVFATGQVLGMLAARFGELAGGAWAGDLVTLGMRNTVVISRLGRAGLNFANALLHITMAAKPLIDFLSIGILKFARWTSVNAAAGRQTGKLQGFFRATVDVLSILISTFRDLGAFMINVGKIGAPLGREILIVFRDGAKWLRVWSETTTGKNTIAKWFSDAHAPLWEFGRLVRDVVLQILKMSEGPGFTKMLHLLRTEVVPAFADASENLTNAFGPVVIQALANFVRLIGQLGKHTGPLTIMVWTIGTLAGFLADLMESSGLFGSFVAGFLILAAVSKSISTVGLIKWIIGVVRWLWILSTTSGATGTRLIFLKIQIVALQIWLATLRVAIALMTAAQWLWNAALLANPVGLVIIALVALAAGLIYAYMKVGWFRKGVQAVWGWIKDHWPLILGFLTGPVGLAVAIIITHWQQIKSVASTVFGALGPILTAPFRLWFRVVKAIIGWIVDKIKWLVEKIGWVLGKVGKVAGVLGDVGGVAGDVLGAVPGLAGGGDIMTGGLAVVGEAGPEILRLPKGASVRPLGPSGRFPAPPQARLQDAGSIEPLAGVTAIARIFLDRRQIGEAVADEWEDKKSKL